MGTIERREREKQQRRADIMKAAKEVFFAKGLQDATMDKIAEKAEYSKGALYLYFQSKEELYLSLLDEGNRIFLNMLSKQISPKTSASKQLMQLGEVYYQFHEQYPQYFEILFFLHAGDIPLEKVSEEVYRKCLAQSRDTLNFVEGLVRKGIEEGDFRDDTDAWKTTLLLWALSTGVFAVVRDFEHENLLNGESKASILDYSMRVILKGLISET
jgi:AcrR family transcriptional regulator